MRTIVFLDVHKWGSSREAVKAAAELGYFTVVLTDRTKWLAQRTEFADVHEMILVDWNDEEGLVATLKRVETQGKKIALITSFSDPYVGLAARLGQRMGCAAPSPAAERMENKVEARAALADSPYVPYFRIIRPEESLASFIAEAERLLPLIVKSPHSTGSKDVRKASSVAELKSVLEELRAHEPHASILAESYLEGPQLLVEAMAYEGAVTPIAVIEQEITDRGRFIVTGYQVVTESVSTRWPGLLQATSDVIRALGLEHGSCHLEWRWSGGEWKLIEINPRMSGGAMNRMLQYAYGFSLVRETLLLQLGQAPAITPRHTHPVYTQYVVLSTAGVLEKVTGKGRAQACPGVCEVYVKPRKGNHVSPPLSMGNRYACVIAAGATEEEARIRAKTAAKELRFHIHPQ